MQVMWTKRDGTKIAVDDMSNSHVLSTLRMILRKNNLDPTRADSICCAERRRQVLKHLIEHKRWSVPNTICECEVRLLFKESINKAIEGKYYDEF